MIYDSIPNISAAKANIIIADYKSFYAEITTSEIILDINCVPLIRASPYFYLR
jgi:hypothetical protein